jgi:thioredoxin 1
MKNPKLISKEDLIPLVTSESFEELVLNAEGPIAVEFMSYSCGYCRTMEPILEEVAEMLKATEKIFKVNMATDQELGDRYSIEGTPTFTMFLNGKKVGQSRGPNPTISAVLSAVAQPFQELQ